MTAENEALLIKHMLDLGRQIERENDVAGHDGMALSEAEGAALVLAMLTDGDTVPDEEAAEILRQYDQAKKMWLTLRAALSGLCCVRLGTDGKVTVKISRYGQKILGTDQPRPPCPGD